MEMDTYMIFSFIFVCMPMQKHEKKIQTHTHILFNIVLLYHGLYSSWSNMYFITFSNAAALKWLHTIYWTFCCIFFQNSLETFWMLVQYIFLTELFSLLIYQDYHYWKDQLGWISEINLCSFKFLIYLLF